MDHRYTFRYISGGKPRAAKAVAPWFVQYRIELNTRERRGCFCTIHRIEYRSMLLLLLELDSSPAHKKDVHKDSL
jgi:hypothetical protein